MRFLIFEKVEFSLFLVLKGEFFYD